MDLPHTRVAPVAASLGAGLLLGLAGPLAGKWDSPLGVALSTVFSGGWSWACYAFLVGCFRRTKTESALLASSGLVIAVVAYYLLKDASPTLPAGAKPVSAPAGMDPGTAGDGVSAQILVWGTAAFVFGAPLGLLGNLARVPGIGGFGFRLVVPLVAFYETSMRLSVEADRQGRAVGVTWEVIRFAAGAVALALVGHTLWSWWHDRRTHTRPERGANTP